MIIRKMTETEAKEICSWEYNSEYSIYNIGGWNKALNDNWAITNMIKREEQFRSVCNDNNKLIGYFRIIKNKDKIKLGLGLHPNLCGLGLGKEFLLNILDYNEVKNKVIELEVREFNKRALKCYEKVGFKIIDKNKDFILMSLNNKKSSFLI